MTRLDHLTTILMEECAEVAQRASKAARFGFGEIQPGQFLTNAERLEQEMTDLLTVYQMLANEGVVAPLGEAMGERGSKREKVEKFLRYSAECGRLGRVSGKESQ